MIPADPATQADFRASWSQMNRSQRRRALLKVAIFAVVDQLGVQPAEVVLALNGPVERADSTVRAALDDGRTFFRSP